MRDKLKNERYFKKYEKNLIEWINERPKTLEKGEVAEMMKKSYSKVTFSLMLNYCISAYSSGKDIAEVKKRYMDTLNYMPIGWIPEVVRPYYKGKRLNEYSEYYMLRMLSLGYLLDISEEDFSILVNLIDRDGVKDYLYEYIIRAKLKDRMPITEESYIKPFDLPNAFKRLRMAITEQDKKKSAKLVREFVEKDFVRYLKKSDQYDLHESEHEIYYGYWSFETAAIVKILGLDDSKFIDCQYYPKDLVHM
jgi:hypothetical protein